MIEVQVVGGSAQPTSATIPLPDLLLHLRWYEAGVVQVRCTASSGRLGLSFAKGEAEATYCAAVKLLEPCVSQIERSVEHPDAWPKFFVDVDAVWWGLPALVPVCSLPKATILGWLSRWGGEWLIQCLRIRAALPSWRIVTFVNDSTPIVFDAVAIRRIGSLRHENDAVVVVESEVHALLEVLALSLAHFEIG